MVKQSCPHGLTSADLDELFGDRLTKFWLWMRGQTYMLCDGREYDHENRCYRATACAPGGLPPGMWLAKDEVPGGHGPVVYRWDVERFLAGLPVID